MPTACADVPKHTEVDPLEQVTCRALLVNSPSINYIRKKTRDKLVDLHSSPQPNVDTLNSVRDECHLENVINACLLHVVSRDGTRIGLGHVLRGVGQVTNDLHQGLGWVNEGVTHHELP